MWKALLVLVVVSDSAPPSIMLGQYKETFLTEADCRKFVASKKDLTKGTANGDASTKYKIIDQRTSCVRDSSGQGV